MYIYIYIYREREREIGEHKLLKEDPKFVEWSFDTLVIFDTGTGSSTGFSNDLFKGNANLFSKIKDWNDAMQNIMIDRKSVRSGAVLPDVASLGHTPTAMRLPLQIWKSIIGGATKFCTPIQYAVLCGLAPTNPNDSGSANVNAAILPAAKRSRQDWYGRGSSLFPF